MTALKISIMSFQSEVSQFNKCQDRVSITYNSSKGIEIVLQHDGSNVVYVGILSIITV